MFEVHTVKENGGEDVLGAGEGRVGQGRRGGEVKRVVERVWGRLQNSWERGLDEEEKRLSGDGMRHGGE